MSDILKKSDIYPLKGDQQNVIKIAELKPRMLMGPGPSDVNPRILHAMARPTLGHLDSQFLQVMDDIHAMLQQVFQTHNELTLLISGTGMAGMEASLVNLLEPGDKVLVCVAGVFSGRMQEVAQRTGAQVTAIKVPWGQVFTPEQVAQAIEAHGPFKLVALVQAETSTGALQPIEPISSVVHAAGALLLVDTVASLGGVEVDVDGWQIDACYSGSQKCLSCPPGLAPLTFGPAAIAALAQRKTPVQSWYLDLNLIRRYWNSERVYHHTAPINLYYAMHEALCMVLEEGLPARWQRHLHSHRALKAGLEKLGLSYIADPAHLLPTLNAVATPAGIDEAALRKRLVNEYGIEIGAGLGEFKGKAWRIGLMGEGADERHVNAILSALQGLLKQ
jgi:alanine-glyoxylate transaminase/serine-glyoxylate transaminase/serine-pyruvate transaminase